MSTPGRRDVLGLLGAAALLGSSGCSLLPTRTPLPRMLRSKAPLPKPFQTSLPFPPVARPGRTTPSTDHYELTQQTADLQVLPGLRTHVWTYDGHWPGPTIESRSGRPVSIRLTNELEDPTVTHLHGGRTPAESDGYPTDLLQPGEQRRYDYPLDQRASGMWYHDHTMDLTGPGVWRGLAGSFVLRDDEEEDLGLPHDDRELMVQICDRSFAEDGSMPYPEARGNRPGVRQAYAGGLLGDVILVNGVPWPRHTVERRIYRLRLLNASNARTYDLSLPKGFIQIGSDGGLLTAPHRRQRVRLAPAERVDTLVDFSAYDSGENVVLSNIEADGPQGKVMRFDVRGPSAKPDVHLPKTLCRIERLDPSKAKTTREFEFSSGKINGHTGWLINSSPFDPKQVDARPQLGDTAIWRITADVPHPFHMHLQHFQVLNVDGQKQSDPPEWKDTIELGNAQSIDIITRFTGYRGRYVLHCHNLEHEDMMMMANFDVT